MKWKNRLSKSQKSRIREMMKGNIFSRDFSFFIIIEKHRLDRIRHLHIILELRPYIIDRRINRKNNGLNKNI